MDPEFLIKEEYEAFSKHRTDALMYSVNYGMHVVKSLILINGGAAIALLTLIGASFHGAVKAAIKLSGGLADPISYFCYGLIAAIMMAVAGYFNFGAHVGGVPMLELRSFYTKGKPLTNWYSKKTMVMIKITYYSALIFGIASAVFFLMGIKDAASLITEAMHAPSRMTAGPG